MKLVWLCSPNNPTGTLDCAADIEADRRVRRRAARPAARGGRRGVLRVRRRRRSSPGGIVSTTCSSCAPCPRRLRLAGARVGFGLGDRSVIERLERVRPPGSISTHLRPRRQPRPGAARLRARQRSGARRRARLARHSTVGRGWQPLPSVTNFLLVRIGDHAAAEVAADRPAARGHRAAHLRARQPVARPSAPDRAQQRRERATPCGGCVRRRLIRPGSQTICEPWPARKGHSALGCNAAHRLP